jgi:hypothetical protein
MELDVAHIERANSSALHNLVVVGFLGAGMWMSDGDSLCRMVCRAGEDSRDNVIIVNPPNSATNLPASLVDAPPDRVTRPLAALAGV